MNKENPEWVITARNKLTGRREVISSGMIHDAAWNKLLSELKVRRGKRHLCHDRLKVKVKPPVQLEFKYEDYE